MSDKPILPATLDDDQALAYAQSIQLGIINEITKTNFVPEEPAKQSLLIKALDGLSRNALTQKKIKSDEATAAGLAASGAGVVAELLKQVGHRYGGGVSTNTTNVIIEAPALGPEIPDPELLPGEIDQGIRQMEYNTFISQMKE